MPQMLQHCGKKFQVRKRAHKLCDTAFGTGGRQMTDAVFLDDLRCDGAAYGGCELRCTIIWKEAWLERADATEPEVKSVPSERLENSGSGSDEEAESGVERAALRVSGDGAGGGDEALPWWKPRQYVEDYRSGNVALSDIVSRLAFLVYAELVSTGIGLGSALRWIYNKIQEMRGGDPYPVRPGHLPVGGPTPTVNVGLKEGDVVRVKSGDEILATVDELLVNRGMAFHPEMMPFCGKTYRISQRLSRLVDEKTGRLKELKNSCIVLEGVDCAGTCTRPLNCPRACPPYWREIWLEPVVTAESSPSQGKAAKQPSDYAKVE